jgi:hypothetical protein
MVCRGEEKVKVSAPQGWASSAPHALLPKGGMSPGSLAHSPQGPPNMVRSCQATRIEGFFRGPGRVAHFADVEVCLPLLLFMRAVPGVGFVVFRPATMVVMVRRVGTTRHHVAPLVAPLHAPKPCEKQKHGHRCSEGPSGVATKHDAKLLQRMRRLHVQVRKVPRILLSISHAPTRQAWSRPQHLTLARKFDLKLAVLGKGQPSTEYTPHDGAGYPNDDDP